MFQNVSMSYCNICNIVITEMSPYFTSASHISVFSEQESLHKLKCASLNNTYKNKQSISKHSFPQ